jgi:dihydroorotase/N-acyl-D-amino-acid deacylase
MVCRGLAGLLLLLVSLSGQSFDLHIRQARIVDGTGGPAYVADVWVRDGRIAAIGEGSGTARRVVEARGLTLAPGFIDVHSHGRAGLTGGVEAAENYIRQGVTTIFEGPDGSSPLPLRPFLDRVAAAQPGVNVGLFVGHGTVRQQVMGTANRQATPEELERMRALVEQAMKEGAFGLSTGLFYVPGNFSKTEEVIALGKVAARFGGIHQSHMRDEADRVLESVKETIRIGEEGGLPTQVTHHKIIGKKNWGLSAETLRLVDEACRRGVDVSIDQYPYTASSTGSGALFPQWSLEGGAKALRERLGAAEQRSKIKAEIVRRIREDRGAGDPANIVFASCGFDPKLAGRSLADVTRAKGREMTLENAAETAIEIQVAGGCSTVYHAISEEDVERVMRHPRTMIASDGGIPVFGRDVPHPRSYGTFARVLGRYVRERKVLTLEEAVHKMSGLPARRMGLTDRGLVRVGMRADLVLFDPARVIDRATFEKPHQYAEGVDSVWVNGVATLAGGRMTGQKGGVALFGARAAR